MNREFNLGWASGFLTGLAVGIGIYTLVLIYIITGVLT